jgi:hypothetical protein
VVFAAVGALGVVGDARLLGHGRLEGPRRTARHLWRLCAALAIAWGSFAGQPKAVPEPLRGSPLTLLPMLAVLVLMTVWLVRLRPRRRAAQPVEA